MMYADENPGSESEISVFANEEEYVNAYVRGDAYNYIINAGKATANFTRAILFVILGFGTLLLKLKIMNNKIDTYSKKILSRICTRNNKKGRALYKTRPNNIRPFI